MNYLLPRTSVFFLAICLAFFASVFSSPIAKAQWHQLPGPPSGPVNDFAGIAGSNERIYAATANGVYRTTDSAHSWHLMGLAQKEVLKIAQYQIPDQEILLAIMQDGDFWRLCRSADSAKTWDTVFSAYFRNILEVVQDGKDIVIGVSGSSVDTNAGIFRSSNLGATWTHQSLSPPDPNGLADITLGGGQIFGIVYGSGVWAMPSKGSNWVKTNYPYWHNAQSLKFFGAELFVGGYGHIDISTDNGASWLPVPNSGLDTMYESISTFAVNGLTIIGAGSWGVYRSADGGGNWTHIAGTGGYPRDGYTNAVEFINNQFISSDNAGVVVSSDGLKWSYATDGLIGGVFDIISNDTLLFALTPRGAFRSTDQGLTWIPPNGTADLEDTLASALTMLGGEIYASGSWQDIGHSGLWRWNGSGWTTLTDIPVKSIAEANGQLYASLWTDGLEKSTDDGASWINASNGLPFDTVSTDAVVAAGSRVLAFESPMTGSSTLERVYASDDDGNSWHFLDSMPVGHRVYSAATSGGIIYAATIDGLATSTDNGETWSNARQNARQFRPFGSGLIVTTTDSIYSIHNADVSILSDSLTTPLLAFTHDKQFAYAATTSRGIWYAPLANLPLGVRNAISAHTDMIMEVYPNPMGNNATASFNMPDREVVSLRIFDERGVCRAILFDGSAGPGDVALPISLSLPPGAYEARLLGNRVSSTAGILIESHTSH